MSIARIFVQLASKFSNWILMEDSRLESLQASYREVVLTFQVLFVSGPGAGVGR